MNNEHKESNGWKISDFKYLQVKQDIKKGEGDYLLDLQTDRAKDFERKLDLDGIEFSRT